MELHPEELDEESPVPLYYQLENLIESKIRCEYSGGEKIPAERILSEQVGVSRVTLRKAMDSLIEKGILVRKRGRGTFVTEEGHGLSSMEMTDLAKDLSRREKKGETKLISQKLTTPSPYTKRSLNIKDSKVIKTVRLRKIEGKKIGVEESYVPKFICPGLLEVDLNKDSIYNNLAQAGYPPTAVKDEIIAVLAEGKLGDLLEVESNTPLIKRERKTYSSEKVVEFSYNFYLSTYPQVYDISSDSDTGK